MLTHSYSYESTLADSLKVQWRVEDLIGGDKRLDFSKPFMPEPLAGVRGLSSLSPRERLLLNQIRGNSYLYLFGFFEEIILPIVLDEARPTAPSGDLIEMRAMLTFAEEEGKHIHLFRRFAEEFAAGFPVTCGVIGPASEVAKFVLSHSKLSVALLMLHLESMTLAHYIDSIRDQQDLDPQFKSLLRHHWMEEAQHAKLDTLLVDKLARAGGPEAIATALADFVSIGRGIDELLQQQIQLDLVALEAVIGRTLRDAERAEIVVAQARAYRYTVLVSGLVNKQFASTVRQLGGGAAETIQAMAAALS